MPARHLLLVAFLLVAGGPAPAAAAPASPPASQPVAAPAAPAPALAAAIPLAGYSAGRFFLRSPSGSLVLFPGGRIQADAYFFKNPTEASSAKRTILVRRARLEAFGWIGRHVGFNIAGEFAAAPPASANPIAPYALSTADNFIVVAPLAGRWRDALLVTAGQFDLPFMLENRTSDNFFDFIERSVTTTFAFAPKKDLGLLISGILPNQLAHYSLGVFNGEGSNFKNVDNRFDVAGRAWVAPFALRPGRWYDSITLGASFHVGDRLAGLPLASQSTPAGFKFFDPKWTSAVDGKTPLELHQNGDLTAWALELDAPLAHRCGVRFELVRKSQELSEYDVSAASSGKLTWLGAAHLKGWALYAQAWAWLIGDDRIVGRPSVQTPRRFSYNPAEPRHGLQLLARVERLVEEITVEVAANGNPVAGHTRVTTLQLGATYWYSRSFRAILNYNLNMFGASSGPASTAGTEAVYTKLGGKHFEHEILLRLAVAL